jgi:N-acetylglucosaminyl-diphospho-decaprenol L-rhamnosyltransferase
VPSAVRLSVIIVAYGGDVAPTLDVLATQRRPGDEIVVVDNLASAGGTAGVADHPAVDRLLRPPRNLHYADGANLGAAGAAGDAIVLLNPDAVPEPGFLDACRAAPAEWDAWSGVLTLPPDGSRINNAGGVVHYLGLAWSGRHGEPARLLPADPYPAGFLSGGCLVARLPAWRTLGGYAPGYGAYHEDVELSLRLRLTGRGFGVVPAARAVHDYAFDKGGAKWRRLETNRWRTVLRTYPGPLLAALLPVLLLAEPVLLAVALRGGWGADKVGSWVDVLRWLAWMPAERRAVQRETRAGAREFARGLSSQLDSPFLGPLAASAPAGAASRAVWTVVSLVLRAAD